MAAPPRTTARFPELQQKAGHYESFYLKLCHPEEPLGLWIRHTVHKRPGEQPKGSIWFTLFDGKADGPTAYKETLSDVAAGPDHYIRIGESRFEPGSAHGSAGTAASWELELDSEEDAFFHLPSGWMYKAPVPRTKLLSPYPDARYRGRVSVDGRELDVDGWRGMVGHNWGAQHAERWIWLHGAGFAEDESAWFDGAIGRIKLGPATTPWIANGVLSLGGTRHRLGGVERTRSTEVREQPTRCEFVLPGKDMTVQGTVSAAKKDFVGWVYADPDGSEHHTVNCSISDMTLQVSRPGQGALTLVCSGAAAYELGMREQDHGMSIQPFPDG